MSKKIIRIIWAFSLVACASTSKVERDTDEKLKAQFPYGLLTSGYGVLTRDDLAIDACTATPAPFSEESNSYLYWKCYEAKNSRLFCEGNQYDKTEKMSVSMLVISGAIEGNINEYISSRPMPLDACKAYQADWKRLTENEKYVCVSGSLIDRTNKASGKEVLHWIFDRFKTKNGCESYFEGGCSLKYQIDHGCNVSEPV